MQDAFLFHPTEVHEEDIEAYHHHRVCIWQDGVRERVLFLVDRALLQLTKISESQADATHSGSRFSNLSGSERITITYPFSLRPYSIWADSATETHHRRRVHISGLRHVLELIRTCVFSRKTVTLRHVYYALKHIFQSQTDCNFAISLVSHMTKVRRPFLGHELGEQHLWDRAASLFSKSQKCHLLRKFAVLR